MIPLSLYIHLPWCEKKCPYCDFNSHQRDGGTISPDEEARYIDALLSDLRDDMTVWGDAIGEREISSVFIGGGTPSLFSGAAIGKLLGQIREMLPFSDSTEITLEANPGSSELEKFADFKQAGVNRLSIGTQSFNDVHLQALGRVHRRDEGIRAAQAARAAGFENFNLDIMFGLPDQSIEQALDDVEQALALSPTHLSCYQLTIEPNTLFHARPPIVPDDEILWQMQTAMAGRLVDAGFRQYEVSAWSLPGKRCRHNTNYWEFGDYLGIGAGAHSKITGPDGRIERAWKLKHPESYMRRSEEGEPMIGARTAVTEAERPFEFMLNALRLTDGFSLALFSGRTGLSAEHILTVLRRHRKAGLLTLEDDYICLTARGKNLIDSLLQDYLPDPDPGP